MKLTNIAIKNTKPQDKPYYLSDGDNLSLYVTPQGGKVWRLVYGIRIIITAKRCHIREQSC
jgi:hypothetical protein